MVSNSRMRLSHTTETHLLISTLVLYDGTLVRRKGDGLYLNEL